MSETLDKVDAGSCLLSMGPEINNEKKGEYKARQNKVNTSKAYRDEKKLTTPKSILHGRYMVSS